ncbi:hypothetical protein [Acidithiobacillus thiooxidans]|uniref:Uncharacterized protein n=1 Tax=Acidithiobacillus thiooxidans ATCC 19377 TaxID=637390 RepID=A0A543Q6Q7_ACITH|nr:hypothetical protein [Acidithiobacillus thiooxidans]MDX5933767.1 hypothetical protein [Acidithiobacillus thiooxidans]TQN52017.1 hypothetical protein DLNHIDIE_01898 [Acidithiobacillus thiooxidans ATCC 19377]
MSFDLSGWKPSCEQAKYVSGSSRIIGVALSASIAGPPAHAILSEHSVSALSWLFIFLGVCAWKLFERVGYQILKKGGC